MDIIFIRDLKVSAVIGVYPEERDAGPQPLLVDLEVSIGKHFAMKRDAIENTVDYSVLTEKVLAFISTSRCYLIEALAEKLADYVLTEFTKVQWLKLTIRKPDALTHTTNVGVVIERAVGDIL